MFKYNDIPLKSIEIDTPNPEYNRLLQQQLSGEQCRIRAASVYIAQSFRTTAPEVKGLLKNIAMEEFGHLELLSEMSLQLKSPIAFHPQSDISRELFHTDLLKTLSSVTPHQANFNTLTSVHVPVLTGNLRQNLLSDIEWEQHSISMYEQLLLQINDVQVESILRFLIKREETHAEIFKEALDRLFPVS